MDEQGGSTEAIAEYRTAIGLHPQSAFHVASP